MGALLVAGVGFAPALDRVRSILALVVGGALVQLSDQCDERRHGAQPCRRTREDSYASAWLPVVVRRRNGNPRGRSDPVVLSDFPNHPPPDPRAAVEGAAVTGATVAASAIVFLAGAWRYPSLIFPFVLWAALPLNRSAPQFSAFLVGVIGTWGAVGGSCPSAARRRPSEFGSPGQASRLSSSACSFSGHPRRAGSGGWGLAMTAARLGEAQSLAHIGAQEWDIPHDVIAWSDELYRIFGMEPDAEPLGYAKYLERVHPETASSWPRRLRQLAKAASRSRSSTGSFVSTAANASCWGAAGSSWRQASRWRWSAPRRTSRSSARWRGCARILSAVSHELRTPLTSILGFALTLEKRRATLAETIDETVVALADAARRLERLLADLLDVERLRRGVVALEREKVDVSATRGAWSRYVEGRQVHVSTSSVVAEVDRAKIERIVGNPLPTP